MSQNDFTIANQGFPAFRADLNSALQALASNSSGTSAPSTTFANMWWYDSANNIMYIRNEDNDAWIKFAELDQTNDKFVLSGTLQLDDGTVSAPALTFNSDTNMGIYRGGTDILKFVTAGTDRLTILADGKVGIGTSSPAFTLEVNKGSAGDIARFTDGVNANTVIKTLGSVTTFGPDTNNSLALQTNSVERMRISSAGNVGIGTSSPANTLAISKSTTSTDGSVYPTLKIENTSAGTGNSYARFQVNGGNGTTTFTLLADGRSSNSDVSLRTNTSTPMSFYTNGSERMRIDSSGKLLINTTSTLGSGQGVLHLKGASANTVCVVQVNNNGEKGLDFRNASGTQVGHITINASDTAFSTSSDYRLKENVDYTFDATTRLKQLKPARFNFIADADTTVDGFLAHEVQSVVPEAITGTHNEVDADGNPVYQGIDQSKLVPLLVKTIQELEARIVALETA